MHLFHFPKIAWGYRIEGAPVPTVWTPTQAVISGPDASTPSPWSLEQDFQTWLRLVGHA